MIKIIKILAFLMLVSITSAESKLEQAKELVITSYGSLLDSFENRIKAIMGEETKEKEEREYKFVVGFSPYTKHTKTKHLNEGLFDNNKLVQVGVSKNNITISYTYFENSFFTDSHAVMIEFKDYLKESKWFYKYGVGIVKGYENDKPFTNKRNEERVEKTYLNFYRDYSILGTVGIGYTYKRVDFTIDLFGECLVTGIRYKF